MPPRLKTRTKIRLTSDAAIMLDVSFSELLLIVVIGVVFLRPKDVPVVVRAVAKAMKTIRDFTHEVRQVFDDITREAGADEIKTTLEAEVNMIKGDDGRLYESYSLPESLTNKLDMKKNDQPE